ncbi:MAG: hypothetical protein DLM56_00425 [Pseudonocardiales bacterium]|nr:MAG: hypothetical protein DLM56_00425 [Pseudonocardiales bacterium]
MPPAHQRAGIVPTPTTTPTPTTPTTPPPTPTTPTTTPPTPPCPGRRGSPRCCRPPCTPASR